MCLEILDVGNLEALAFFKGHNKLGGLEHGIKGARIQPSETALHNLNLQSSLIEVMFIDSRDLQFSTG